MTDWIYPQIAQSTPVSDKRIIPMICGGTVSCLKGVCDKDGALSE
jgi:hypothetical protein